MNKVKTGRSEQIYKDACFFLLFHTCSHTMSSPIDVDETFEEGNFNE
jgi:hypothetical protein